MKYANLGTVSHATMLTEDLIPTFLTELEWQLNRQERTSENRKELDRIRSRMEEYNNECFDDNGEFVELDDDSEIVEDLFELLDYFSSPYCYFGSHPGDGSDYGYWLTEELDIPKYSDLADVPKDIDEDYAIVNDHGNVTIYSADGNEILAVV